MGSGNPDLCRMGVTPMKEIENKKDDFGKPIKDKKESAKREKSLADNADLVKRESFDLFK